MTSSLGSEANLDICTSFGMKKPVSLISIYDQFKSFYRQEMGTLFITDKIENSLLLRLTKRLVAMNGRSHSPTDSQVMLRFTSTVIN
jgi:hypothetical protein